MPKFSPEEFPLVKNLPPCSWKTQSAKLLKAITVTYRLLIDCGRLCWYYVCWQHGCCCYGYCCYGYWHHKACLVPMSQSDTWFLSVVMEWYCCWQTMMTYHKLYDNHRCYDYCQYMMTMCGLAAHADSLQTPSLQPQPTTHHNTDNYSWLNLSSLETEH